MKNSRLIIKEFKTVNKDLIVYLSKSNLTSIKLTFDMSSNNNQLKRTLLYNGSNKPLNSNTDEFWDLFISNPDRTMTNNRNQDYKLKSPPHRISTLISLLLKKYIKKKLTFNSKSFVILKKTKVTNFIILGFLLLDSMSNMSLFEA